MPYVMKIQFKEPHQWDRMAEFLDQSFDFQTVETWDVCSNERIQLIQIISDKTLTDQDQDQTKISDQLNETPQ
jgi:hypothetical protein